MSYFTREIVISEIKHKFMNESSFFSIGVFFHEHSRFEGQQGKMVYKKTGELYIEWQRVTKSGTTSDND